MSLSQTGLIGLDLGLCLCVFDGSIIDEGVDVIVVEEVGRVGMPSIGCNLRWIIAPIIVF